MFQVPHPQQTQIFLGTPLEKISGSTHVQISHMKTPDTSEDPTELYIVNAWSTKSNNKNQLTGFNYHTDKHSHYWLIE